MALHESATAANDKDGNVVSRTDKQGTTTYVYDPLGRLVKEELPGGANACSSSTPKAITYTYDKASNLVGYCDAGGTVTYTYDKANRLTGVATGTGTCTPTAVVQPCTTYHYNTVNQMTSITYPTSTGWSATLSTYTGTARWGSSPTPTAAPRSRS